MDFSFLWRVGSAISTDVVMFDTPGVIDSGTTIPRTWRIH
jgi:hypothetical protein